jgi:acyl-CoA thioesterase FadM
MEYRVVSEKLDGVVAEGEGVIVIYDYRSQKKAALPMDIRRRIEEIENRSDL